MDRTLRFALLASTLFATAVSADAIPPDPVCVDGTERKFCHGPAACLAQTCETGATCARGESCIETGLCVDSSFICGGGRGGMSTMEDHVTGYCEDGCRRGSCQRVSVCLPTPPGTDAGTDAGGQDAGSDGGASEDAGADEDGGPADEDGGPADEDAGSAEEDAGSAEEDAGSDEEDGGSAGVDAGGPEESGGGCGCRTGGSAPASAAVLLLGLVAVRRRPAR